MNCIEEEVRSPAHPAPVAVEDAGSLAEQRETVFQSFAEIYHEMVQCRGLLWQMTLRDVRLRYKQAIMGFAWALLLPALMLSAGYMVKFAMAQMAGVPLEASNFAAMAVKSLAWAFFISSITFATTSLTANTSLVAKIYFPREVFPFSTVLTQTLDSSVGVVVLAVILFGFLGVGVSIQLLWVLPLLLLLFLFTTGASLFVSSANLFFRDVKYLVQVVATFGIFFAPVFYEVELFGSTGAKLLMLNPIAPLLEGLRLVVVQQHNLLDTFVISTATGTTTVWQPAYLLYSAAWATLGFLGASWLFHRLEFIYAEYI